MRDASPVVKTVFGRDTLKRQQNLMSERKYTAKAAPRNGTERVEGNGA